MIGITAPSWQDISYCFGTLIMVTSAILMKVSISNLKMQIKEDIKQALIPLRHNVHKIINFQTYQECALRLMLDTMERWADNDNKKHEMWILRQAINSERDSIKFKEACDE